MSQSLISVVIPTYQRAETVRRALRSLIDAPPNRPYEVVVVDNASSDRTEDVVAAASEHIPNLHFHQWSENLGPLENWRRGIELATGSWLKIIWSDDWVEPGAIDRLLSTAESTGSTTVTCGARLHHQDRIVDWYTNPIGSLTPEAVAGALLALPAQLPASPSAAVVRREQALEGLASVKLPEECAASAIGPDVVLTYWDVFNGGIGTHIDEPLVNFGLPDDSITLSSRRGKLLGCYASSLWALLEATDTRISDRTMRRLRHRGTLAAFLGARGGVVPTSRRFSMTAAAADAGGVTRYATTARRRGRA